MTKRTEQKDGGNHELHIPSIAAILDLAREVRQPFTIAISAGGIGVALLGLAYKYRGDGYRLAFHTALSFIGALDDATYRETANEFKFPIPDLPGTTRISNSIVRELTQQGEALKLINPWFYGLPILEVYEAPSIQDGFHLQEIRVRDQNNRRGRGRVQRRIVTEGYKLRDLQVDSVEDYRRATRILEDYYPAQHSTSNPLQPNTIP